ncbi:MAG TPA: hypothetical protein VF576_13630 [Rubricoccaceae bacterium]|jgi:hypothetical protein
MTAPDRPALRLAYGPAPVLWGPPTCLSCGRPGHRVGTDLDGWPTYGCGTCIRHLAPTHAARVESVPAPTLRLVRPLTAA